MAEPPAETRMGSGVLKRRWTEQLSDGDRTVSPSRAPVKYLPFAHKLAIAIATLIVTGMSVLGLIIISNQTELIREQINDHGRTIVGQLSDTSEELVLADDNLALDVLVRALTTQEGFLGAAVYSDDAEVLSAAGAVPTLPLQELLRGSTVLGPTHYSVDWTWTHGGDAHEVVSFLTPVKFKNVVAGFALVTFSRATLLRSSRGAVRLIVVTTILMSVLASLIAFVMSTRLAKPIYDLVDASAAIERGDFAVRIRGRRNDELGELMQAINNMAKSLLRSSQVEDLFSRYVSTNVAKQILDNTGGTHLGGKHVEASVLFADIVGFTGISEKLPPNEVAQLLNEYYSHILTASKMYHGTIDKYIGDCAMVVFGVPEHDERHAFHAVGCAVMIQQLVARLNEARKRHEMFPVNFRIGVNTGVMLAGNLGSPDRMQYTVVGDAVNLASRLSAAARPGQIVVTEELRRRSDVREEIVAREHRELRVRGKQDAVMTYIVEDVATPYRAFIAAQVDRVLAERFAA